MKTYYEKQIETLNKINDLESKKTFVNGIDYSIPIEKDSDAQLVKELKMFEEIPMKESKSKKNPYFVFEKEGQAKLWWFWNKEEKKWEIIDKTDILNEIKKIGVNTISQKDRTEIINALEGVGRENIPEELSRECVQFKNKIINIKTGEE